MRPTAVKFCLGAGVLTVAVAMIALAQNTPLPDSGRRDAKVAQVVELEECDPATFNAALGPHFRKIIAFVASTTLTNLLAEASAGTPYPNWDFEPDTLHIKEGTVVSVTDEGGEPHTFTEGAA